MEFKVNLPKDQVDKVLLEQIEKLKKENRSLENKLKRANTATAYTDQQRDAIRAAFNEFQGLMKKHSWVFDLHDDCH